MTVLSSLRSWRHDLAARRTRPASGRKPSAASRKRRLGVELLEERLPAGTFFNGFGFGAAHTLPLGFAGSKPLAGLQGTAKALTGVSNLGALSLGIAPLGSLDLSGPAGAKSTSGAAKPASSPAPNGPSPGSDPGFNGNGSQSGAGTIRPGLPSVVFGAPGTIPTSPAGIGPTTSFAMPPVGAQLPSGSMNDGGLFQLASAAVMRTLRTTPVTFTGPHTSSTPPIGPIGTVHPTGILTLALRGGIGPISDISDFIGGVGADEFEVSITVNPTNPNNVFVTSNATGPGDTPVGQAGGVMVSYTTDGGASWHPRYIATGADTAFTPACCDVSAAFDRFGNLWFSYISASANSTAILLSTNGGVTFQQEAVFPNVVDQPKLAVGNNSVWVVWTNSSAKHNLTATDAFFDGFNHWKGFSGTTDVPLSPDGESENFGKISVGPKDQVMVSFQSSAASIGEGPDRIWSSVDMLGTRGSFATPILVTDTNVGNQASPSVQAIRHVSAQSEPAYDRSGGPFNGRVYMVYSNRPSTSSNNFDIFLVHSDDNGSTWSSPLRITDDNTKQPKIFPRVQVDQTTGNVAVSWLDGRNGGGTGVEEFIAFSNDGGQSFTKNIQVATANSNATLVANPNQFGDYTGLTFNAGIAWPAWPDNSTALTTNKDAPNTFDVATAPVTASFFLPAPAPPGGGGGTGGGGTGGGGTGGGGTGGGGSGPLTEDAYEPNDSSTAATNFGVLVGSQDIPNLTITRHASGLPDRDWYKWTAGSGGTFTATETIDSTTGGLEEHLFKLVGNSLQNVGNDISQNTVKTLSASVNAGDVVYVEVKGISLGPGQAGTGAYHLDVSVG